MALTELSICAILNLKLINPAMSEGLTNSNSESTPNSAGILDTIIGSQTQTNLSDFEPVSLMAKLLLPLKDRERMILVGRFGLDGQPVQTLEVIGRHYNLTRERVRQLEKDAIHQVLKSRHPELLAALQLVFDTIVEHGNVMAEEFLFQVLLPGKRDDDERRAVRFLLQAGEQFVYHRADPNYFERYSVIGFDPLKLDEVIERFIQLLTQEARAWDLAKFLTQFKTGDYYQQHQFALPDKALHSYLNLTRAIHTNPFNEVGLSKWADIKPHDVGDKAYLVLKHNGKPEHYSMITRLINEQKFDHRTAYQETVHNELIKDQRFVLVGRGIYALSEWGYKRGVVADVIKQILRTAGRPLARDEIIAEVLKRRMIKRNTILVGLSNKKHFRKVDRNKFTLASEVSNDSSPH